MRSAMEELEAIAFARATDVLREEEGKQVVCWDTDATAAIAGLEQSGGVWKVKFYDKLKAQFIDVHTNAYREGEITEAEKRYP